MDEVTRRDIVKILDDCRDSGNSRQPGKILAVTRMLFKFAIQRGVLDSTPCMYIEESQPEPAQRAMSAEQIELWWNQTGEAIDSEEPKIHKPTALALRLLLLTGQRPGEVANMTRNELYLDSPLGAHWIIAGERRKKGRAKAGKPHAVALEPQAVAVIEAALELSDSDFVFQKASGGPVRTDSGLSAALGRVFGDPPRPTPHAARHTVATELADLGIDEYRIGRVLGHTSKTVTGTVYINNRINEPALRNQRALLSAWESGLLEIVSGKQSSKVANIAERRA
jgi:integrase